MMDWRSEAAGDEPEMPERDITREAGLTPHDDPGAVEEIGPGMSVIEDSPDSIQVASHAGDFYSKTSEAASVRFDIDRSGSTATAHITELGESEFAAGSDALRDTLRCAEDRARSQGADVVRFDSARLEAESVPSSQRRAMIELMLEEGYDVGYRTRTPDGSERFIREWASSAGEVDVLGEPDRVYAVKDLAPEGQSRERHLVPATVIQELDDAVARSRAEVDSRIQDRTLTGRDARIIKGDAGEGRTYVDLLERYERDRIDSQPRFEDPDVTRNPDFVVTSDKDPNEILEIVDSKAWSLARPRDGNGEPLSREAFLEYLQSRPPAERVLNMRELGDVVSRYASSPRLAEEGKVVLYLPDDVVRYAPQVKEKIEGWSGTEVARGRDVEVRSMGASEGDLWEDMERRQARSRRSHS